MALMLLTLMLIKNAFDLYKYSRDNKDELMGQIGEMKTELAVKFLPRNY